MQTTSVKLIQHRNTADCLEHALLYALDISLVLEPDDILI
jgi:hypothetical protein